MKFITERIYLQSLCTRLDDPLRLTEAAVADRQCLMNRGVMGGFFCRLAETLRCLLIAVIHSEADSLLEQGFGRSRVLLQSQIGLLASFPEATQPVEGIG